MNFLAHGWHVLDQPWVLAGTAVPDLLAAFDRSARVRRRHAVAALEADDVTVAEIARGIVQHHDDDAWFHVQPVFVEQSLRFAVELREQLGASCEDVRFGFVGHVLVEMLLDAVLMAQQPSRLGQYYGTLDRLDPATLQQAVGAIGPNASTRLGVGFARFLQSRFLEDYATDAGLLGRLNQVLARVTMPPLPDDAATTIGRFRAVIAADCDAFLPPPPVRSP